MNKDQIEAVTSSNNHYARGTEFSPIVRIYPKIPKNSICPITNTKFKKCCGKTGQDFCEKSKEKLKEYLLTKHLNEAEKPKENQ